MNETDYHRFADMALNRLHDILEHADENGLLDVEYQDGVMTVRLPSGKHYIINKHTVSREIWLSSPLSGGLHFRYEEGEWKLPDGRILLDVFMHEMHEADVEVNP